MKDKLSAYYPLWLILIISPLALITVVSNFIMSAIGLFAALITIKANDLFVKYSKSIIKLWCIAMLASIITAVLFFIPQFFSDIEFVKNNLAVPLIHNPYSKFLSFIYTILVFLSCVFVVYKLVKRTVIMKLKENYTKHILMTIIITIFIIPYAFYVPTDLILKYNKSNINDYRGTLIQNSQDVVMIMKNLETSKYMTSHVLQVKKEPYTIHIYLSPIDLDYAIKFEKDAAVLLYLVDNANEVIFHMNKEKYTFNINRINDIYKDIRSLDLDRIYNRYKSENFKNYVYLGHTKKYDIFDISDACEDTRQLIYETLKEKYYLKCTDPKKILLYDKEGNTFNVLKAIKDKKISVSDLLEADIELIIEVND